MEWTGKQLKWAGMGQIGKKWTGKEWNRLKTNTTKYETSVVQFDLTKHCRFSPGTPVSSCSNTGPMWGGPYWTTSSLTGISRINSDTWMTWCGEVPVVPTWVYVQCLFWHFPHLKRSVGVPAVTAICASSIASFVNFLRKFFISSFAISWKH